MPPEPTLCFGAYRLAGPCGPWVLYAVREDKGLDEVMSIAEIDRPFESEAVLADFPRSRNGSGLQGEPPASVPLPAARASAIVSTR